MTNAAIEKIITKCEDEIGDTLHLDLTTKDRLMIRVIVKNIINAIEGE